MIRVTFKIRVMVKVKDTGLELGSGFNTVDGEEGYLSIKCYLKFLVTQCN